MPIDDDKLSDGSGVDRRWRRTAQSIARITVELSRSRDRETVLQEIVAEARHLLEVDLAYLSLNDAEHGLTYVHTTDGVLTDAYRNIRLPFGMGVLGRVARSMNAAQTSDYFADLELERDPDVDVAVRREGVRSILGAPMRIDDSVMGALMVADRAPRVFDAVEVAAISALASLAAVALETTQLISSLSATVRTLELTEERNRRHIADLELLSHIDGELLCGLVEDARFDSLIDVVSRHLGADAVVRMERHGADWGVLGRHAPVLERLVERSEATDDFAFDEERNLTVLAVVFLRRRLGVIAVGSIASPVHLQILRRVAMSLSARVLAEEALESAERREHDDLLRLIVSGSSSVRERLQLEQISPVRLVEHSSCHVVVFDGEDRRRICEVVGDGFRMTGAAFIHDDHVCVLANNGSDALALARTCLARLQRLGIKATAGTIDADLATVEDDHHRALRIARSMTKLGRVYEASNPYQLGSVGLLIGENSALAEAIVEHALGPALEYDREHRTTLLGTALTFLDSDRSVGRTATALLVHENTVRQRLEKLKDLLGAEWLQGTRALDAHLALRSWSLSNG